MRKRQNILTGSIGIENVDADTDGNGYYTDAPVISDELLESFFK